MTFGKVVVVRESLLPLLKAVDIAVAPQLRALCHNRQRLIVDVSLELKEGKVCALEPSSSFTIPALSVENTLLRGNLHGSWDSPAISHPPTLSLLSSGTTTTDSHASIRGCFSVQGGIVCVGITEQLMRLMRHVVESSKILSHSHSHFDRHTAVPAVEEVDTPAALTPQSSDLWPFAQDLVEQLAILQNAIRQHDESSRVTISRPSSAGSTHSRSVRNVIADYSHSPRNMTANMPPAEQTLQPDSSLPSQALTLSNDGSSSSEVAIQMEQVDTPTSPNSQSPMDTSGGDLASSDDMQLSSGSNKAPSSSSLPPTSSLDTSQHPAPPATHWLADTLPLQHLLQTPHNQLSHSIFGLIRVDSISFSLYVETSITSLRLAGEPLLTQQVSSL